MKRFGIIAALVAGAGVIAVAVGVVWLLWRGPARPAQVQDWRVLRGWLEAKGNRPTTGPSAPYYIRVTARVIENDEWGEGYRMRMEGREEGFYYHIVSEVVSFEHRQFASTKVGDTLVVEGWIRALEPYAGGVQFRLDHPRMVAPK